MASFARVIRPGIPAGVRAAGVLAALALQTAGTTHAQFAYPIGGADSDTGQAVSIDDSGVVAVTGLFRGSADFDPGPGSLVLNAVPDERFVVTYTASGDLRHAFAFGGQSQSAQDFGIAQDALGNVFVVGSFFGIGDFDPGPGTVTLVPGNGACFIASYDADGNYRFAFNVGNGSTSNSSERCRDVEVDDAGNLYVTGAFDGTVDFDPTDGELLLQSNGGFDAFVASYSGDGTVRYAYNLGGPSNDGGYGIALDGAGNVIVAGEFRTTADFDPTAATLTLTTAAGSGFSTDAFVAGYDAGGQVLYAAALGGTSDDSAQAVDVDAAGNAFATGRFLGSGDFDPGPATLTLSSAGLRDIFLVSIDLSGQLRFAFGLGAPNEDMGHGVAVANNGDAIIVGRLFNGFDFDPGPGEFLTSTSNPDGFVARYDNQGAFVGAALLTTADNSLAEVTDIAIAADDTMVTTGTITSEVDADYGPGTQTLTSINLTSDAYVSSFALPGGSDVDADGVPDGSDNCTLLANADQRDTNGDGFGNVCDPDLNDDGIVNATDLGLFKAVFFTTDADADFNGDGVVNATDLGTLKTFFFQPPGPSGVVP